MKNVCLAITAAKIFRDIVLANDLGFTESTVAALVGHSTNSITSKYIHSLDSVPITAADTVAGYVQGLLDGAEFRQMLTPFHLTRSFKPECLPAVHRADSFEEAGPAWSFSIERSAGPA